MREIKFRAWSLREQCWEGAFSSHKNGYFRNGDTEPIWQSSEDAGVIVMQFTGLLDKNGKEVYEGDIVQLRLGNDVLEVRWSVLGFRFFNLRRQDWQLMWAADIDKKRLEVIGNIYQHSYLLSKGPTV